LRENLLFIKGSIKASYFPEQPNMKSWTSLIVVFLFSMPFDFTHAQQVVRVTEPSAINPAEVSIAINPHNPENMIAASFQIGRAPRPRSGSYHYVTSDGGKTWKTVPTPNLPNLVQGDDVVVFSSDGVAYHVHLSFDGIRQARPARAENGMIVNVSKDEGNTWTNGTAAVNHVNTVIPFEDKPGIIVDTVPASRSKGNLYLSWTRFDVYGSANPEHRSQIYFTRSTDQGQTFSMPFRISDTGGDCVDSDNTVEGAVPAVGPNGEIYVVWAGPLGLVLDKSTDGGLTFGTDKVIGNIPGGWDFSIEGLTRANGMPVTGVDLSNGPHKGTLYVNWIDARNGDPDVFVMSSKDGGGTWSSPVRVNDDPVKNGKAQFFTWMSVDPADGSINVVFYDRRDGNGTQTRLTMARSIDGGRSFVNHKIDLPAFTANSRVFFGDYGSISAYQGRVVPVFMHFVDEGNLAISVALYRFKLGTQEVIK
jgi:hypothetical protein